MLHVQDFVLILGPLLRYHKVSESRVCPKSGSFIVPGMNIEHYMIINDFGSINEYILANDNK
jgi:hypothetical protein